MAISKSTLKKMAKALGIEPSKIDEALTADTDIDIEIPDGVYMSDEGKKRFGDQRYNEGKEVAIEVAVKDIKREKGYDFKGKGLNDLVSHLESNPDVEGKVKKLQDNISTLEKRAIEAETKAQSVELYHERLAAIPAEYGGLTKKELDAIAAANGIEVKKENGKLIAYRNGQKVLNERDQTEVDAATVYKNFFETERKLSATNQPPAEPQKGGRGGDNKPPSTGGVATKRSELIKEWQTANPEKSVNGMEFQSYIGTKYSEAKAAGISIEED
jgi:hypothetical protein